MLRRILINPFFIYILSFTLIVAIFSLKWSETFSELDSSLILFLVITFVVSFYIGFKIDRYSFFQNYSKEHSFPAGLILLLILAAFIIEYLYSKNIPFLELFNKSLNKNTEFGIPTFHSILVSFTSFYSVSVFTYYLNNKKKRYLLYFIISLFPSIFLVNRIMFMLALVSCFFVALIRIKRIRLSFLAVGFVMLIGVTYIFGYIGNYRSFRGIKEALPIATKASNNFLNSGIPYEFYWTYIYAASPIANLNYNIVKGYPNTNDPYGLLATQFLPDFMSKRVTTIRPVIEKKPHLLYYYLNVCTIYTKPFLYYGWPGIIIMFAFIAAVILLYLLVLIRYKEFYVEGLAILLTLVLFNTFDNMYYYSGLSFQLVYPLIFGYYIRRKAQLGAKENEIKNPS